MFNNIILSVMAWTTNTVGGFVTKLKEERGQDILEYAVLVGAIALVAGFFLFVETPVSDAVEVFRDQVAACIEFSDECGDLP